MVKYTDEELTQLTTLGTDIYKYVEAQFAHWVVDGGIDEEWDAYLKQLDSMGLQDLMNIQNGAYEAYPPSSKYPKGGDVKVKFLEKIYPADMSYEEITEKVYNTIKKELK